MKRFTDEKGGVHPIILNNMMNERAWFGIDGNYHHMFDGIDGYTYSISIPPDKWPSFVWDEYEEVGISVDRPTPVEDIVFPVRPAVDVE